MDFAVVHTPQVLEASLERLQKPGLLAGIAETPVLARQLHFDRPVRLRVGGEAADSHRDRLIPDISEFDDLFILPRLCDLEHRGLGFRRRHKGRSLDVVPVGENPDGRGLGRVGGQRIKGRLTRAASEKADQRGRKSA